MTCLSNLLLFVFILQKLITNVVVRSHMATIHDGKPSEILFVALYPQA